MGSGDSKVSNEVENVTNDYASIVSENIVNNSTNVKASNKISFSGNCTFKNSTIVQNMNAKVTSSSINQSLNDTELQRKMETIAKQQAENITQSLNLNSGSNETKNINKTVRNIHTEIKNINRTDCITNALLENAVECDGNATVDNIKIDQNTVGKVISECYQKSDNITKLQTELKDIVDQKAKQEMKGFSMMSPMMLMIIGGCILVLMVLS